MECTFYAHTNCPEVYEEHGSDLRKTDFFIAGMIKSVITK